VTKSKLGRKSEQILANNEAKLEEAIKRFNMLFEVEETPVDTPPLIYYRVSREGVHKLF
jgi:hypothetical protein